MEVLFKKNVQSIVNNLQILTSSYLLDLYVTQVHRKNH